MLGDDIVVHVMEIVGNTVRIGIEAPALASPVYREEIWDAVRDENRAAADAARSSFPRRPPAVARRPRAHRPRCARRNGVRSWRCRLRQDRPQRSPSPTSRSPSRAIVSPLNFPA